MNISVWESWYREAGHTHKRAFSEQGKYKKNFKPLHWTHVRIPYPDLTFYHTLKIW